MKRVLFFLVFVVPVFAQCDWQKFAKSDFGNPVGFEADSIPVVFSGEDSLFFLVPVVGDSVFVFDVIRPIIKRDTTIFFNDSTKIVQRVRQAVLCLLDFLSIKKLNIDCTMLGKDFKKEDFEILNKGGEDCLFVVERK